MKALDADSAPGWKSSFAGNLYLEYQPIVSLVSQEIAAFEVLTRCHDPFLGIVPPLQVVPWIKRIGLSGLHTRWVLRGACREAALWSGSGAIVDVSVNVSPQDLSRPRFPTAVIEALRQSDLDPKRLQLEVTEDSMVDMNQQTRSCMNELRSLGVRFAMDDFGAGYAGLSTLQDMPVDTVKLDRSLVQPLAESSKSQKIVDSVIALSHDLGIEVVGEGVETRQQLAFLTDAGCDLIQGHFFSPALGAERVANAMTPSLAFSTLDRVRLAGNARRLAFGPARVSRVRRAVA